MIAKKTTRLFYLAIDRFVGPRGKRILHTGAWSLIAKACGAANLFVAVPFVLRALGPAQFGAWATLVSLITFAGFLDFGLGNGTMNLVASARGRDSAEEVAVILRQGAKALLKVSLALTIGIAVLLPLIPWYRVLGLAEAMSTTSRLAVAAVLFTVAVAVPLNLANRAQLGLGKGNLTFRWQAAAQLLTLITVILIAKLHPSLPALTLAAVATPLLGSGANTISLWRGTGKLAAPQIYAGADNIAKRIRREGILFFVLQVSAALAYSADLPLISSLVGSAEAGTYAIVQRLFSLVPLTLSLIWVPLWPIYRQALAAEDNRWVVRTLRHSLIVAVGYALVCVMILAFGFDRIVIFWVHQPVPASKALLAGIALWTIVDAAGTALATLFNAASVITYQIITGLTFAVTCFAVKAIAIPIDGITVVPWITLTTYCTIGMLPLIFFGRRIFRKIRATTY